jgi:hypothetical protein
MGKDYGLSGPQGANGSTGFTQPFPGNAFSAAWFA